MPVKLETSADEAEINVIPFIDISLVLMVVFMLVAVRAIDVGQCTEQFTANVAVTGGEGGAPSESDERLTVWITPCPPDNATACVRPLDCTEPSCEILIQAEVTKDTDASDDACDVGSLDRAALTDCGLDLDVVLADDAPPVRAWLDRALSVQAAVAPLEHLRSPSGFQIMTTLE